MVSQGQQEHENGDVTKIKVTKIELEQKCSTNVEYNQCTAKHKIALESIQWRTYFQAKQCLMVSRRRLLHTYIATWSQMNDQ